MNRYETILMVDTDAPAEDQETIFEKIRSLIQQDGRLIMFDDWGVRKFAYEIKKKRHGHYIRLDYCGSGDLVNELERILRLDFRILKFMTVRTGIDVDPEAIIIEESRDQEAEAKSGPQQDKEAAPEKSVGESAKAPTEESPEESIEAEAASEESPGESAEAEAAPETETEKKE